MWKHPGTTMSPQMTFALKNDVRNMPVKTSALTKLMKYTPNNWASKALHTVDIDWGGKGVGHDECTRDAEIAFSSALIAWAHQDNSVAITYGQQACTIIKRWSETNKVFKGNNAPLEAAWMVCSLARASELIKHHPLPNIKDLWKSIEPMFFRWLDSVIMPVLKTASLWKWPLMGNWHHSIICARMQLAILREDKVEWDWCVKTYKDILPRSLGPRQHFVSETLRDCTHAMFLIGGLLQVPEMAIHQGVDLYDVRMHGIMEYHARIMLGEVPQGINKEEIKTPYGLWPEPVWESGYAHFTKKKNMPMPNTQRLLRSKVRPERVTFHWGGGTLTHATEA